MGNSLVWGYPPLFGKNPNLFCFVFLKASLSQSDILRLTQLVDQRNDMAYFTIKQVLYQ